MVLTPTRQVGPTQKMLSEEEFQAISKDWNSYKKLDKEALKRQVQGFSRVSLSFDQGIDKASLVATIMFKKYGRVKLELYSAELELRKKALKLAKRKERKAAKEGS